MALICHTGQEFSVGGTVFFTCGLSAVAYFEVYLVRVVLIDESAYAYLLVRFNVSYEYAPSVFAALEVVTGGVHFRAVSGVGACAKIEAAVFYGPLGDGGCVLVGVCPPFDGVEVPPAFGLRTRRDVGTLRRAGVDTAH